MAISAQYGLEICDCSIRVWSHAGVSRCDLPLEALPPQGLQLANPDLLGTNEQSREIDSQQVPTQVLLISPGSIEMMIVRSGIAYNAQGLYYSPGDDFRNTLPFLSICSRLWLSYM